MKLEHPLRYLTMMYSCWSINVCLYIHSGMEYKTKGLLYSENLNTGLGNSTVRTERPMRDIQAMHY